MTAKARLFALGLIALLYVGASMPSMALGSEPEDPFWKVGGSRLESGSAKGTIKNVIGVKTTLQSKIGTTEVAIRCETGALGEGALEGSLAKHAGKASGTLELTECKLFSKAGGVFTEQPSCEVPSIKSGKLAGGLWLEGTKGAGGTTAVVVFEPKELTEGKPLLAKIAINKETCSFHGNYALTGSFAVRLLPQNEEFTFMQWVLPQAGPSTVWRPPGEEAEASVGLKLEGNIAGLQGEMKVELESKAAFGGGTAPVAGIEAPFWGVNNARLGEGEEKELEAGAVAEPAKFGLKIGGTEVQITCVHVSLKEAKIVGSHTQSDGRFVTKTIEFTECKLLAKEGEKFNEQKACEVVPLATKKLSGKLWLEGAKEARGTKPLLVLEPPLTEGKSILAEVEIKSKAGEKCGFTVAKYAIEGVIPIRLSPENQETSKLGLSITETSVPTYQPAEQEGKQKTKIAHEGEEVTLTLPTVPTEIKGGGTFGGGPVGVGSGPFWHVNGSKLESTRQVKLQSKGPIFVKTGATLEIFCRNSISEGATIEGGAAQGQAKGRLNFSSCKVPVPATEKCVVAGGQIKTNPLKSYMATAATQTGVVAVFEPGQGSVLTAFFLENGPGGTCPFKEIGYSGSIVAEILPTGAEQQESLLLFPTTAILKVKHEGKEVTLPGLKTVGIVSTFSAAYGSRLATGERWGAFIS
jgi:hypothetical protein